MCLAIHLIQPRHTHGIITNNKCGHMVKQNSETVFDAATRGM